MKYKFQIYQKYNHSTVCKIKQLYKSTSCQKVLLLKKKNLMSCFVLKFIPFILLWMFVCTCICVPCVCLVCLKLEEGSGSPGTGLLMLSRGCWELPRVLCMSTMAEYSQLLSHCCSPLRFAFSFSCREIK